MTATAVYARRFASLVKIEHSVFALPYAYSAAILAEAGIPPFATLFWITVAMVGARSLAMALNRLIDAEIDARNPRTARREIPAGLLNRGQVLGFAAVSLAVFLIAVWQLPSLTHVLWPIPVIGFVIYPYLKRFTWTCHFFLGAVDGLAPLGGWIAVTNHLGLDPFLLGGAVALWIAGFDIIYATMDLEIDRAQGLNSVPLRFGVGRALADHPGSASDLGGAVGVARPEPGTRAPLLPGSGGDRGASHLRERDRERGRPESRRHGLSDHERRDRGRVPGRCAARCRRLSP